MRVLAKRAIYYNHRRWKEGQEFELLDPKDFSKFGAMEPLDDEAKAAAEAAAAEVEARGLKGPVVQERPPAPVAPKVAKATVAPGKQPVKPVAMAAKVQAAKPAQVAQPPTGAQEVI